MSRHHRAQKWTSKAPKLRAAWAEMLPRPCLACGRVILKGESFHVGHIRAASLGGQPTMQNTTPMHARCNLSDGGKLGAAVTNSRRKSERDRAQAEAGRRSWR
ncbi:HNH endonuclease [Leifsonia aquatica]|uniref:HNH endonuclease n=1 Tax=Leifsonia aquatica TaxID=144185 RepID=UPI00381E0671